MKPEAWILENGSGSLRRAVEEGLKWYEMYLHERAAMEIATAAELVHSSRLTTGPLLASPDCPVTTETCWYARTLRYRLNQASIFASIKVVYYTLEREAKEEGAGLLVENLELDWLPNRSCIIPVATWDGSKWEGPHNPL